MLNGELFHFYAIGSLDTAKALSFIHVGPSRTTSIPPCMCTCTDTIINFKLKIISSRPCSNVGNIKSDNELIMFSCNSCEVFGKIISIDILSCKLHCAACESVRSWGCETIKRQCVGRLKISEKDWSLIFWNAGIVRVSEVFVFEDWVGTDIATVWSGTKASGCRRYTVRMTEVWTKRDHNIRNRT